MPPHDVRGGVRGVRNGRRQYAPPVPEGPGRTHFRWTLDPSARLIMAPATWTQP